MTKRRCPSTYKFGAIHESDLGEDFRDVPGTGGLVRVSKDGVVISRRRVGLPDGWWLKSAITIPRVAKPYQRVSILFDGRTKTTQCHLSRIILMAWVGLPPSKTAQAAHRDGAHDNDHLDNLLWVEPVDVKAGQICRGTWVHGENTNRANHTVEQIAAARRICSQYGVSVNLLATALGMTQTRVREWMQGVTWNDGKWDGLKNLLTLGSSTSKEKNDGNT